mgnify:FL=1
MKYLSVAEGLLSEYPTVEQFLISAVYNPDGQTSLCRNVNDCWFGEHPTLILLDATYKKDVAEAWLVPQLVDISEYSGAKDKLTKEQVKGCAFVIRNNYGYLKVSEVMLFCHRFKSGQYGDFYGGVSPLTITTALRQFINDRAAAIERKEQENREKEMEESRKYAISWEEYCKRKGSERQISPILSVQKRIQSQSHPLEFMKKNVCYMSSILASAHGIVDNPHGYDFEFLQAAAQNFQRRYGCTAEDYIKEHEKDSESSEE